MICYRAPLRDYNFVLNELLDYQDHLRALQGVSSLEPDEMSAVLESAASFAENTLVPLYQSADREGCRLDGDRVYTPSGFREAYDVYRQAGWIGMARPECWGGSALPPSLATVTSEIFATANWSWSMYPNLLPGAMDTLEAFGTEEQKARFLPKLVSGRWTATMCLTEPQCGSDLSLVRMQAEATEGGGWLLRGNKIFITAGDHDLTENIVHIVLARLPDAPAGTRGLSLFIVPKFRLDADGSPGARNGVVCGGLEEKMGLKGSATCALYFDGAQAELLGPPHRGLECMFVFMNAARIGAAQQGVVHAELGYQNALSYARERRAALAPGSAASTGRDPIVLHPDVRRMLLEQRAIAEGGRALILEAACLLDLAEMAVDSQRRESAREQLAFLTPILKGFITELGVDAASLAIQCLGGHGYIREWGLEQNLRDSRIATIYEGTTGIQALDLLGRKVVRDRGRMVHATRDRIRAHCAEAAGMPGLDAYARALAAETDQWTRLSEQLIEEARRDPYAVPAAATAYLMYAGYLMMGDVWLRAALLASRTLAQGAEDACYRAKLSTAAYFFSRMLPRALGLRAAIASGPSALRAADDPTFADPSLPVAPETVETNLRSAS